MHKLRRIIGIVLFSAVVCCCISAGVCCYADGEESSGYENYNNFPVEIAYENYSLQSGSILRTISITMDMSDDVIGMLSKMAALLGVYSDIEPMLTAVGYKVEIDTNGKIVAYNVYDSVTDLYIAYGIDGYYIDESEPNPKDYTKKSFFFVDSYSYSTTVFDDVLTNEDSLFNYILKSVEGYGFTESDILFTYRYGTPYKIINSDADTVKKDADYDVYVHTFYMTADTCGREICLSQHSPNQLGWYLVALGVALVIALSFVVIAVAVKRKRR